MHSKATIVPICFLKNDQCFLCFLGIIHLWHFSDSSYCFIKVFVCNIMIQRPPPSFTLALIKLLSKDHTLNLNITSNPNGYTEHYSGVHLFPYCFDPNKPQTRWRENSWKQDVWWWDSNQSDPEWNSTILMEKHFREATKTALLLHEPRY